MALIVIDVVTLSSGFRRTEVMSSRRDRDADLADLAFGERVIGVVSHLRRQVERHREAGLARRAGSDSARSIPRPGVAGVLAHRPNGRGTSWLHAAGEGVFAGKPSRSCSSQPARSSAVYAGGRGCANRSNTALRRAPLERLLRVMARHSSADSLTPALATVIQRFERTAPLYSACGRIAGSVGALRPRTSTTMCSDPTGCLPIGRQRRRLWLPRRRRPRARAPLWPGPRVVSWAIVPYAIEDRCRTAHASLAARE